MADKVAKSVQLSRLALEESLFGSKGRPAYRAALSILMIFCKRHISVEEANQARAYLRYLDDRLRVLRI